MIKPLEVNIDHFDDLGVGKNFLRHPKHKVLKKKKEDKLDAINIKVLF